MLIFHNAGEDIAGVKEEDIATNEQQGLHYTLLGIKCGFEESGLPFWEAGIKHIKMQRRI